MNHSAHVMQQIGLCRCAWLRAIAIVLVLVPLLPITTLAATTPPDRVYFPQTGHYLAFGFLDYWLEHGRVKIFGYPITDEFQQNGTTVRYFERAVFEYHPNNPPEWQVEPRRLGAIETTNQQQSAPFQPVHAADDPNCTFYAETGHRLCFGFRSYWQEHGGLRVFGYPISEEFTENGYTVQYFERARFEYHPKNSPGWQVELGLLGDQAAQQNGVMTAPLAQSTTVPNYDLSLWPICQPGQLRAALGQMNSEKFVGFDVFILRNAGSTTCTLSGYPGVQLLDAQGNPLPTNDHRNTAANTVAVYQLLNIAPQLVFVAPSDMASFDVAFFHSPFESHQGCETSAQVGVTPPNGDRQLVAPAQMTACGYDLYVSPVVWGSDGVPQ